MGFWGDVGLQQQLKLENPPEWFFDYKKDNEIGKW